VQIEIALQYANEYTENLHAYVNNIHTPDGGTHVIGFRTALTRTLNQYGRKEELFKDLIPTGEDFREGLTAIVAVRVPEPQFQAQTKNRLNNPEVEGLVNTAFGEFFARYLEENPKTARAIVQKGLLAAEAREAARKAKEVLRNRKGVLGGGSLPGKLRDCLSKKMEECELYLVEGDSAGGSAEGGRIREFQAILPLRGKIINAYKSREDKVLDNAEIQAMIQAIGTGIGADQDLTKLRYNKIIIMTDADVDGSHIRTLLLCFFYRQMYQLVAAGHVYVAQPPLYRVVKGKGKPYYVQTDEEMKAQLMARGVADAELDLGEGHILRGARLEQLTRILADVEEAVVGLERRGISLRAHAQRRDATTGKLPEVHAILRGREYWFADLEAFNRFREEQEAAGGAALSVSDEPAGSEGAAAGPGSEGRALPSELQFTELHEVRTINRALSALDRFFREQELGLPFSLQMLIPQDRTGSDQPRYVLRRGEHAVPLEDLRGLAAAVRELGQKGLTVTRFKGLGEMNAEELRETTLDPAHRTLIRVKMDDVAQADEMFRILMGEKVEPRRDFIEKHALEVRHLDI
jgi:DNA gyrase subunit B